MRRSAGEEVHTSFPLGVSGRLSMARSLVGVNMMDMSCSKPGETFEVEADDCDASEAEAFPSFLPIRGTSSISRLHPRIQMAESMVSSSDAWTASRTDSCQLSS